MIRLRKLTMAEVEFRLECLPEDTSPRGYFASGEDALDLEDEAAILARLAAGDQWAWCVVKVTAIWKEHVASDTLGACSYANEADFRETEAMGYHGDMRQNALDSLNERLARAFADVEPLLEEVAS